MIWVGRDPKLHLIPNSSHEHFPPGQAAQGSLEALDFPFPYFIYIAALFIFGVESSFREKKKSQQVFLSLPMHGKSKQNFPSFLVTGFLSWLYGH